MKTWAGFGKNGFSKLGLSDQAVKGVQYVKNDPTTGALITIDNLGQMALPVTVKVTEQNGRTATVKLPVEIWQRGAEWTFKYPSTSPITSVILDPGFQLPDVYRSNNSWLARMPWPNDG